MNSRSEDIPIETVRSVLESGVDSEEYESISNLDKVSIGVLSMPDQGMSTVRCDSDIHAHSIAWYNLGWTEYRAHVSYMESNTPVMAKKSLRFLRAAAQFFKRATEIEAGNSEFWNSLGIATAALNPKVS